MVIPSISEFMPMVVTSELTRSSATRAPLTAPTPSPIASASTTKARVSGTPASELGSAETMTAANDMMPATDRSKSALLDHEMLADRRDRKDREERQHRLQRADRDGAGGSYSAGRQQHNRGYRDDQQPVQRLFSPLVLAPRPGPLRPPPLRLLIGCNRTSGWYHRGNCRKRRLLGQDCLHLRTGDHRRGNCCRRQVFVALDRQGRI